MREKIIIVLFKISLFCSSIADELRGTELYDKEYEIYVFGKHGWFC